MLSKTAETCLKNLRCHQKIWVEPGSYLNLLNELNLLKIKVTKKWQHKKLAKKNMTYERKEQYLIVSSTYFTSWHFPIIIPL